MSDTSQGGFWDRVAPGHTTAMIGQGGRIPQPPRGLWTVRVRADGPPRPLGPVLDARERVSALLGLPALEDAAGRLRRGIRRHLLGDDPAPERDAAMLAALDRLADVSAGPTALIFEAVDAADTATLNLLGLLVRQPLRPALVLGFRAEPERGPARELYDALVQREGEGRVVRAVTPAERRAPPLDPGSLPTPVRQVLQAASVIGEGFEHGLVARLLDLSELTVLLRLQEAADLGVPLDDLGDGRFRVDGAVLETLRATVLPSLAGAWHRALADLLQNQEPELTPEGADLHLAPTEPAAPAVPPSGPAPAPAPAPATAVPPSGPAPAVPPDPDDDIPAPLFNEAPARPHPTPPPPDLRVGGLAAERRLVTEDSDAPEPDPFSALAGAGAPPVAPPDEPPPPPKAVPHTTDDADEDPFAALSPGATPRTERPAGRAAPPPAGPPAAPSGADSSDPFDALAPGGRPAPPPAPAPPAASAASAAPEEILWVAPGAAPPRPEPPRRARAPASGIPGRAAHHLAAAGEAEQAIPRFLAAARQAVSQGAYASAETYVERALALQNALPDTPGRRELRARAHAELARIHWEGSGPGLGFTLAVAQQEAEVALKLAGEVHNPLLEAEVRALIAAISYDLGDEANLQRALAELTAASRLRVGAGDAPGAARLLNDAAAVWVRMGDPVRAHHLLVESREVFAGLAERSPEARLELAETDHLLARLPLVVEARPGAAARAIEVAVAHADAAAETYETLGARRELGRVWTTLGELEHRRGGVRRGLRWLSGALQLQREIGDAVGLTATATALAEALGALGQPADALRLLAEAVQAGLVKGLPLQRSRAALTALEPTLPPELRPAAAVLRQQLDVVEERLGSPQSAGAF